MDAGKDTTPHAPQLSMDAEPDTSHDAVMHGMYGVYPMSREASGTSWQPDSTQMPAIHKMYGPWSWMFMGFANAVYDHQRGARGGKKFFSENMLMATAQRDFDCSTLAFRTMFSLEPGTIGRCGYPLLLQTGETGDGRTALIDRQHPHDLFMELAAVYTLILSSENSCFIYFGLPGEPAIGPPVFMHRFSGIYNPEAPIAHHWLDSTHITFGVATLGYIWKNLKLDGSIFTGREPDQHRWNFEKPRFDSYSIRLSYNPIADLAFQVSYAFIKSPEQLEPCVDIQRATASISYNKIWQENKWQTMLAWGHNKKRPGPGLNAVLLESTLEVNNRHIFFGRVEYVQKDELFLPQCKYAGKVFNVGKLNAGYIFEFPGFKDTQWGIGFSGSVPFLPTKLKPFYSGNPFSYMIFLRVELRQ